MHKRAIALAAVAAALSPAVAQARFGDADTSYGRGGVAPVKVPNVGFPAPGPTWPAAIRLNSGNTIDVVAPTGDGSRSVLSQLRYDATLTRISQVRAPFGVSGFAVAHSVRSAAGFLTLGATVTAKGTQPTIVRTTATGALDGTFGSGGVVRLPAMYASLGASRIAPGPAGTVVVALLVESNGTTAAKVRLSRLRANGTLDPTFGTGGTVTIPLASTQTRAVNGLSVMGDGRAVLALSGYAATGDASFLVVMRRRTNGAPDTTFDTDGIAQTAPSNQAHFADQVIAQPDGKVTVLATDYNGSEIIPFMYRLQTNGRVDTSFGMSGSRTNLVESGSTTATAYGMTRRADGRYVAAVRTSGSAPVHVSLARTNANGQAATVVALAGSDNLEPVAVAADGTQTALAGASSTGRIVVTRVSDANTTGTGLAWPVDAAGGIVMRSAPDNGQLFADGAGGAVFASTRQAVGGNLEVTASSGTGAMNQGFGLVTARGGIRYVGLMNGGTVTRVRRLGDGRVAVTTARTFVSGGQLIMLKADGSQDGTFAGSGVLSFGEAYAMGDVIRLPDGKLLLAMGYNDGVAWKIRLMRLTGAGAADATFGVGGGVDLPYPAGLVSDTASPGAIHVHVGAGGYIAVGGAGGRAVVARVSTSGVPDPTLGGGSGAVAVGAPMRVAAAEVDRLGRTVIVGANQTRGVIIRLTTNLTPDTTFSGDGALAYIPPRGVAKVTGVAALPDRSLVLQAADAPVSGGGQGEVLLMVSSSGVLLGRVEAYDNAYLGAPVPTPDGRMVVGTTLRTLLGQSELNLRRIKGVLPAAPLRARRTIGRTFKVSVDARGLTRTTVLIQALRSGRWKTIGSKLMLARVGYRGVSLSTSRRVTDTKFRAVVINASGRSNGRAFTG